MKPLTRRSLALAVLVSVASFTQVSSAAMAQSCGGDGDRDRDGGTVIGYCVGVSPGRPPSSTTGADVWYAYCAPDPYREGRWVDIRFSEPVTDIESLVSRGYDPSGEYGWFVVFCMDGSTSISEWDGLIFEITPPVPPERIRDRAMVRIDPPAPTVGSSPPFGEHPAIVQLPTWLWVEDPWEPITASETQGLVTVEVAATPMVAVWRFGDGGVARCDGPGVAWSEATDAGGTYCSYTFTSSSAGEPDAVFEGSVTVTWQFRWWLNGRDMGVFTDFDAVTGFEVAVGEIQAVEGG